MDAENKVLIEWLLNNLNRLRNSGANWTLTLHGGAGGDIKHEIKTTGDDITEWVYLFGQAIAA